MTAPPARTSRPVTRVVAMTCALALALLLLAGGGDDHGARLVRSSTHSAFDQDLWLTTDAGATAMFQATNLAPGARLTRCIAVTSGGSDGPVTLRLHGTGSGALAPHVHLRVESGTGGGAASCHGFHGVTRFRGSLASFFATHGSAGTGLLVGAPAGDDVPTTFRFTLTVDAEQAAPATSTTASFAWVATPSTPAAATASPTPLPAPGGGPWGGPDAPAPGTAPTEPAGEPGTEAPSRDDPRPTPRAPVAGGDEAGAGGSGPGRAVTAANEEPTVVRAAWRTWLSRAGTVAVEVAERASIPLGLWLVVVIFLAIQDLIDRRDPKLALAQKESEPYLEFIPPPTERGRP